MGSSTSQWPAASAGGTEEADLISERDRRTLLVVGVVASLLDHPDLVPATRAGRRVNLGGSGFVPRQIASAIVQLALNLFGNPKQNFSDFHVVPFTSLDAHWSMNEDGAR